MGMAAERKYSTDAKHLGALPWLFLRILRRHTHPLLRRALPSFGGALSRRTNRMMSSLWRKLPSGHTVLSEDKHCAILLLVPSIQRCTRARWWTKCAAFIWIKYQRRPSLIKKIKTRIEHSQSIKILEMYPAVTEANHFAILKITRRDMVIPFHRRGEFPAS